MEFEIYDNDNNKIDLPPYLYQNNSNWVDSILNQMSIDEKIAQSFFVAANSHSLEETEDFFREMGTKELQDLGLDPDAIRIKLDQIMEWNDPNINPTSNK